MTQYVTKLKNSNFDRTSIMTNLNLWQRNYLKGSFSRNILTPWQPMRCSLGSFSQFSWYLKHKTQICFCSLMSASGKSCLVPCCSNNSHTRGSSTCTRRTQEGGNSFRMSIMGSPSTRTSEVGSSRRRSRMSSPCTSSFRASSPYPSSFRDSSPCTSSFITSPLPPRINSEYLSPQATKERPRKLSTSQVQI